MSQISVNDISSLDGKSGPVISGITTVSSTGYMQVPVGDTMYRYGAGNENTIANGLVLNLDASKKDSYPEEGNVWYDLSGNNNTATTEGNPEFFSTSNYNYFKFRNFSSLDYFTCVENGSLDVDYVTISCWLSTNVSDGYTEPVMKYNSVSTSIPWGIQTYTNGYFYFHVNTGTWLEIASNLDKTQYFANRWYNQVLTYDGTNLKGYINGSLVASRSETGVLNKNDIGLRIGHVAAGTLYISQVSVYDRGLTELEVKQNFNALRYRFGV